MKLLRSQKNRLFDILEQANVNPSMFLYVEKDGYIKIALKDSDFHFLIRKAPDHYPYEMIYEFAPGLSQYKESNSFNFVFSEIQTIFFNWAIRVRTENAIEDKWVRLDQEIKSASISFEAESDKFSYAEYQEVVIKVRVLKEQIKTIPLEPAQLEAIENKLDHLITQAETLSKFDWKSMFVGTMITIIIQLTVSQTNAKALWDLIKQVFAGYFLN